MKGGEGYPKWRCIVIDGKTVSKLDVKKVHIVDKEEKEK